MRHIYKLDGIPEKMRNIWVENGRWQLVDSLAKQESGTYACICVCDLLHYLRVRAWVSLNNRIHKSNIRVTKAL